MCVYLIFFIMSLKININIQMMSESGGSLNLDMLNSVVEHSVHDAVMADATSSYIGERDYNTYT